jgi:hypothetical protein
MRRRLAPKVARTPVIVVPNGYIETDNVPGLRSAETGPGEWFAKPTRVKSVDRSQWDAKLHDETVRTETGLRVPHDGWVVRGVCETLVANRGRELEPLVIDNRIGTGRILGSHKMAICASPGWRSPSIHVFPFLPFPACFFLHLSGSGKKQGGTVKGTERSPEEGGRA